MNKALYLFFLALFLSSCGIKKIGTIGSALPKNTSELITKVNSNKSHPKWLSLKGKVNLIEKNHEITVKINIKNRKDSIIWVSGSGPFGVEVFRVQLTPDSIYFLNRINKTYLIKPVSRIKDFITSEFSFYDIQDIITASPKILKNNYILEVNEFGFYLNSENASYEIDADYRIQNAKWRDNTKMIEFTLEDYQKKDNFPRKITLKIESETDFKTVISYSKVEFKKSQKILFEIPYSYDEIK